MTNALFRDDVAMPVPVCGQLLTASRAPGPIVHHIISISNQQFGSTPFV